MALSWINRLFKKTFRRVSPSGRKQPNQGRFVPDLEPLSERILPAVTALFVPSAGLLTVLGDAGNNTITVSRDVAGKILVNGGAVAILGGTPTVANTTTVSVFGLAGNDAIALDETNGVLPAALLFGGAGDDTMTGGSGADLLFGDAGNDILSGKGGNDLLFGGDGNDVLIGGAGNDQAFGQAGDDQMIWNPGDGSDLNEGGAGNDTVQVNGGNGSETFTTTPNGSRVRFDRTDPAPFTLDIGTSENLVVNMNGGDDVFTGSNGLGTLIALNVNGGAGNDTITGGDGNDTLIGGDGNDLITGGRGNDMAFLGAGDDTFVWNPGDGSDTVEGMDGHDTMVFNGANVAETVNVSANGGRVLFTRNVGTVTMDLNGVERVDFNALGGADSITVNDLSGTDLNEVNLNLQAGTGGGDGAADTVTVNGTNDNDHIDITGAGDTVNVTGLSAAVKVTGSEGDKDQLVVHALDGSDTVNASTLPAGVTQLTLDGGAGHDTLFGSQGADTLQGGDGNDFIVGGPGNDTAFLGDGDDTFVWNPGDGSDTVEGQGGNDALRFFGGDASENIDLSANGTRLRLSDSVDSVVLDVNAVEAVNVDPLGGADTVTVNDLSGTGVVQVNLILTGPPATAPGDGQTDTVVVNGTNANDQVSVTTAADGLTVTGLAAGIAVIGPEAGDQLVVNGLAGDDTLDASGLQAGVIGLTLNGGAGADILNGSQGNDLVIGGTGNDTASLGAGDDTFVWNPGDASDTVEGGDGTDTLQFNGANIGENIDLSANGTRLRLSRDVGGVTMDVNGVEVVNVVARGGADTVTVNDLSGIGVNQVNLDLAGTPGSGIGDGAADTVTVKGTADNDVVTVVGDASGIAVIGLPAQVNITGAEGASDQLNVSTQAGDDVVQASGLAAGAIRLTADGGDGNDELIGSPGNDTLLGGAGDDVLIGQGGQDVLDGGTGDNVVIP
jgi:Ca2+-binding RTX toxin-like protein